MLGEEGSEEMSGRLGGIKDTESAFEIESALSHVTSVATLMKLDEGFAWCIDNKLIRYYMPLCLLPTDMPLLKLRALLKKNPSEAEHLTLRSMVFNASADGMRRFRSRVRHFMTA